MTGATVRRTRRIGILLMVATWLASALIIRRHRNDYFYDVDEGMLGEAAARVMIGELPHRDFADVYTGALAELDAAAFRIWGVSVETLRTVLVIATLLWIPVLFLVAQRLARPGPSAPWVAALLTVTAVCWSVPNHPRGMPTWYTLFLATAGTGAMLRFIDTRRRRWMLVAGVAAGVSCAIKIVGLYFIAAVLLFALLDEQETNAVAATPARLTWYSLVVDAMLIAFGIGVTWLVRGQGSAALVEYALPVVALVVLLIWREHATAHLPPVVRAAHLVTVVTPFAVGITLPIALFLVPYVRSHSVPALVRGVFVTPLRRIGRIDMPPPPTITVLAAVPIICWLRLIGGRRSLRALISISALAVVAVWSWLTPVTDQMSHSHWEALYRLLPTYVEHGLIPLTIVIGALAIARRRTITDLRVLALTLCVLATGSLVQFPFALRQYFLFVAPLLMLAMLALAPTRALAIVAAAALAFAIVRLEPTLSRRDMGDNAQLDLPLGGPRVAPAINQRFRDLRTLLHAHARGEYIYAGPDSPQVYFLTGYRNPTPTLYEVFDDTTARTARVLRAIDAHGVTAVVISTRDGPSGPMNADLRAQLVSRFPAVQTLDYYEVRWR